MENKSMDTKYRALAWRVLATTSAWIVGPILIAWPIGNFLDKHYNSSPWGLLISLGVSFLISMYGLLISTLKEFKKMSLENQKSGDEEAPKKI
jgi:F0F1-type ATP synthase assembly protein I